MIDNILQMNSISGEQAKQLQHLQTYFVDLVSERVGGETLHCSDDFFAAMENLIKPGRGIFIEDKYTDRGKWMDGWESRRSYGRRFRQSQRVDHDWCIIRLGMPGRIKGVDVDTNYFRGNAPESIALQACNEPDQPNEKTQWYEIITHTHVKPHCQNIISVNNQQVWTHVKLKIFPDGGVARLRVYGEAAVNWDQFVGGELIDLAAIKNGAKALLVSDMFFSDKNNLIMPGPGKNMGDGWETKRRRDPGPDWSIVKLADRGYIKKVIIDTAHFKGNFPDSFMLQGLTCDNDDFIHQQHQCDWQTIIDKSFLHANREHLFVNEILTAKKQSFSHVKLSVFPDGGISRMRLWGSLDKASNQ